MMNIEEKVKVILSELSGEDTIDNASAFYQKIVLKDDKRIKR